MAKKKHKHKHKQSKGEQGRSRIAIFRFIAFSIPLLFFILLEIGLRIGGYGESYPLFIDTPDSPNYLLARPDIIKRYFAKSADIPTVTLETNLFLKEKPKNGLRIILQGGSTAAGFPYGYGASPAGMLDQRLKRTFPDRTVEVINTAMSAVNSYTLLDFVDEIIEQQPDAVLIYAGHNEYLGILGVGSNYTAANSHAANLIFLKIREFRIFQLIQNIVSSFQSKPSKDINDQTLVGRDKRTMMAKVAKDKNIKMDSETYRLGLKQFKENLSLILGKYQKANIPVYLSTIASNLKDQKPFSSLNVNASTKDQLNQIAKQLNTGNDLGGLKKSLSELSKQAFAENNATIHYQLGKIFLAIGDYPASKGHFIAAKENDLLRFRAPEDFNRIIRSLAIQYKANIVDYQSRLSKSSKTGIIGNEFMLEHLHPNLQGYFILSDSFYQKLKEDNIFGNWKHSVSTSVAWKQRPIVPAEEYAGYAKIAQLKSDYPFTSSPQPLTLAKPADWQQQLGIEYFQKKIGWLEMLNRSYAGYLKERNVPMILKTSQIIADALPHNAQANYRVGRQLIQEGEDSLARIYFQRAIREEPENKIFSAAIKKLEH